MTEKEAQEVLKEFYDARPDELSGKAKGLFDAIMKIADRRDEVEYEYYRDTHILQNRLDLANAKNIEKDKIIDLMAEYISKLTDCPFEKEKKYLDCEEMCDVRNDLECWKVYFERKAKELDNEKN